MNAYLITHNPDNWAWTDFKTKVESAKSGIKVTEQWTCHNQNVVIGDRIFIIRTGNKGRGIFGAGRCVRESYQAPHYNPEKAANGENASRIDVEFDYLLDPDSDELLDPTEIDENSLQDWYPRNSGISINSDLVYDLELAWGNHIGVENDVLYILKASKEIDSNLHDGSYTLVKKAVELYANLNGVNQFTFADIDLIYILSTIRTNTTVFENCVDASNLPQDKKTELKAIIQEVWNNAVNGTYENIAKLPYSVGMFGAGFQTFNKSNSDADLPDKIVKALIYFSTHNEDEIYTYIETNLNTKINGISNGSFSTICHCLKPDVFPIVNNNEGYGNVFSLFGVNLNNLDTLADYAHACRQIKAFRDSNFSFTNYRVMDLVARMMSQEDELDPSNGSFLVFQREGKNGRFAKESTDGLIEAPKKDKSGKCPHHWKRLENVNIDDVIFHISGQSIAAISTATSRSYSPDSNNNRVNCNYRILKNKVPLDPLKPQIISACTGVKNAPFIAKAGKKQGQGNQGYLFDLPTDLFDLFVEESMKANPDMDFSFLNSFKTKKIDKTSTVGGIVMDTQELDLTLNMVLSGPPGTGKTYNTKIYTVAICKGLKISDVQAMPYSDVENEYNDLDSKNRIAFTTFHQSYGYEDFIEGLKPEADPSTGQIKYPIAKGVFGAFCEAASKSENKEPFVFVIDEINRGNISKIFGELITLIEPTKRIGSDEEMFVDLPYSKTKFGVPNNVYILGTMNTADRSIALMDTALRRRFDFVEMMPDSTILTKLGANKVVEGTQELDVVKMLDSINERIEVLYDREHTIGHAFFTPLAKDSSLHNLRMIFENKVIPLLQEYFYEDYKKIQLVLGDNDKSDDKFKFVIDKENKARDIFKGNVDENSIPEKKYTIQKEAFKYIESYIEIIK